MATINFYLKKEDKKGEAPVMLTYQKKGEKFRYYTGIKVKPASWVDQRVKSGSTGSAEINSILDDFENGLKTIEREAIFNKKEYSVEVVKRKFLLSIGQLSASNDFFKVYDKFIQDSMAIKTPATIQTYAATKMKLIDFAKSKNLTISFDAINQDFYDSFVNFMLIDLKHLNNTVGKHIKTLKVFLTYAKDREYCNQNFNLKKFKVFTEDADIIYLTEQELMKLYSFPDLPERLKCVRDSFCFGCFTGLRFSDLNRIAQDNIKGDFLEFKTTKTKDSLKIPLNDFAKDILNRYRENEKPLPNGISNQKTNDYLKEIGEIIGLDEKITIHKFNGSKRLSITKAKYELLTTHAARRTFVTLALEKGMRAEVVMNMTGHKNYKTFKRYIKITDKVMQIEMDKIWKKPLLQVV